MKMGLSVSDAVQAALADVADLPQPRGEITLCAINAQGEHYVAALRLYADPVGYYVATDGDDQPVYRQAVDLQPS